MCLSTTMPYLLSLNKHYCMNVAQKYTKTPSQNNKTPSPNTKTQPTVQLNNKQQHKKKKKYVTQRNIKHNETLLLTRPHRPCYRQNF
jgi:hypothetical protein